MDEKKKAIQLSDILIPHTNDADRDFTQSFGRPDRHDSILNNTFIEDTITSDRSFLQNPDLTEKISILNDKKNQLQTINNQLGQIDEVISSRNQGRGITQLGQRSLQVSEGRRLTSIGNNVAADIEELRGNINSAKALRESALGFDDISSTDVPLEGIEKEIADEKAQKAEADNELNNIFLSLRDEAPGTTAEEFNNFSTSEKEKFIRKLNKSARAEIRGREAFDRLPGAGIISNPNNDIFGNRRDQEII